MLNSVSITGRLTKNAQARMLPSGKHALSFTIAVNNKYKTKNGEYKSDTSFFDVEKIVADPKGLLQSLTKGRFIVIEGSLQQQRWTNKKDGAKRSKIVIFADKIEIMPDSRKKEETASANANIDVNDNELF